MTSRGSNFGMMLYDIFEQLVCFRGNMKPSMLHSETFPKSLWIKRRHLQTVLSWWENVCQNHDVCDAISKLDWVSRSPKYLKPNCFFLLFLHPPPSLFDAGSLQCSNPVSNGAEIIVDYRRQLILLFFFKHRPLGLIGRLIVLFADKSKSFVWGKQNEL